MIRVTEVILWKYPDAKFTYGGDQVQLAPHIDNGNDCEGLAWLDENIDEPSQADVDSWRADAEEAYKWDEVRAERDVMLRDSDKVMLSDYPMADKSDWENYRQELRDIPEDFENADDVEYPSEPS